MKGAAALLLALATGPAFGQQWLEVARTEGDESVHFVDASSVRMRDGLRQAWVKSEYATPQKHYGKLYRSAVYLRLFDCANEETTNTSVARFEGDRANGTVVSSDSRRATEALKDMEPVVPGSVGAAVSRWVCGLKISR